LGFLKTGWSIWAKHTVANIRPETVIDSHSGFVYLVNSNRYDVLLWWRIWLRLCRKERRQKTREGIDRWGGGGCCVLVGLCCGGWWEGVSPVCQHDIRDLGCLHFRLLLLASCLPNQRKPILSGTANLSRRMPWPLPHHPPSLIGRSFAYHDDVVFQSEDDLTGGHHGHTFIP
jgi:hypothetical protein